MIVELKAAEATAVFWKPECVRLKRVTKTGEGIVRVGRDLREPESQTHMQQGRKELERGRLQPRPPYRAPTPGPVITQDRPPLS